VSENIQPRQLNRQTFGSFLPLFKTLIPLEPAALVGIYQAELVGPAWLRKTAPLSLALGGLPGWWGKAFDRQGHGDNILRRRGSFMRVLPMVVRSAPSRLDGKEGITISYPAGSSFPWPWIVDEVRRLGPTTLLGMTLVALDWAPKVAFPFLLHYREKINGL
jgi:hypothetical protein